jgi:hypothetical protein
MGFGVRREPRVHRPAAELRAPSRGVGWDGPRGGPMGGQLPAAAVGARRPSSGRRASSSSSSDSSCGLALTHAHHRARTEQRLRKHHGGKPSWSSRSHRTGPKANAAFPLSRVKGVVSIEVGDETCSPRTLDAVSGRAKCAVVDRQTDTQNGERCVSLPLCLREQRRIGHDHRHPVVVLRGWQHGRRYFDGHFRIGAQQERGECAPVALIAVGISVA